MDAFTNSGSSRPEVGDLYQPSQTSDDRHSVRVVSKQDGVKQTTVRHGGRQFLVADARAREIMRVPTLETLHAAIQGFEHSTGAIFCIFKSTKSFGELPKRNVLREHRIRWESRQDTKYSAPLEFDGRPYVWLASRLYRCNRFGNPEKLKSLARSRLGEEGKGKLDTETESERYRPCLCPAAIHVAQLVRFPAYRVDANIERRKERMAEQLKRDWNDPCTNCVAEQQFVVSLPPISDHNHTLVTASHVHAYTKTDTRVIAHIHAQYRAGVRALSDMKLCVRDFVARQLTSEALHTDDPRFFPSDKNICNNMYRAKLQLLAERSQMPHAPVHDELPLVLDNADFAGLTNSPAAPVSYEFPTPGTTVLPSISAIYVDDYPLDAAFDDVPLSCCDDCVLPQSDYPIRSQQQQQHSVNVKRLPEILNGNARNEIRFIAAPATVASPSPLLSCTTPI